MKIVSFDVPGGTLRLGVNERTPEEGAVVVLLDPLPRPQLDENVDKHELDELLSHHEVLGALHGVEALVMALLADKPDFDLELLSGSLATALDGIDNNL